MTLFIAAMVVASACIHPFWNLLIKGDQDRVASWWLFTVMLSAIGFKIVTRVKNAALLGRDEVTVVFLMVNGPQRKRVFQIDQNPLYSPNFI